MTALDDLWDFFDPPKSEAAFRARLAEPSLAPADRLEAQTQLARALGLQRLFVEAHTLLDEVEGGLDALPGPVRGRVRVRYLLERGRAFNSARQPDVARPLFESAWNEARAAREDALAVDAAHMLAIVERGAVALRWNEEALAHAERSSDPRARQWRGSLHNNLGWAYHGLERYGDALAHFKRALACREEAGDAKRARIARWCIGRCLRSLARHDEALALQRALLADGVAAGDRDPYVLEEIAECLHALGRADEARAAFASAAPEIAAIAARDGLDAERVARLERLAR